MTNRKDWFEKTLKLCADYGYRTTPIFKDGSAKPFGAGQDYKNAMDYKGCSHIGLVLDDCVLVDYDGNKTPGIMSVDELADALDEIEMPNHVQINNDGDSIHWLYTIDNTDLKSSNDGWYEGVDIKTGNQLMHIKQHKTLNLTPKNELFSAPDVLVEALGKRTTKGEVVVSDLGDFEGLINDNNMSRDDVELILQKLDNNMPNSEWVKVGQALHDWHQTEGLDLWETWSVGGDTYEEGETTKRWKSFKLGGGVTLGTLIHFKNVAEHKESKNELVKLLDDIKKASESDIELDIIKKVRLSEFSDMDKERLAKALQSRLLEVTEVKQPISTIRKMINRPIVKDDQNDEWPEWCKQWVYVNTHASFMNLNDMGSVKTEGFNIINGKYVPMNENGNKLSAVKYISDNGYRKVVNSAAYLPMCADRVCFYDGEEYINTFNHLSVPPQAQEYDDSGIAAVDAIIKHTENIFKGDKESVDIMIQWLAYQIQFKGRLLMWSPLIQSFEGIGKTFYAEVLACGLGARNVSIVAPEVVTSPYTGWASGSCVCVLEEIKLTGHNRHDVLNTIKPFITNNVISVSDKYIKAHNTINTTNYIAFTNHRNALPLTSTDRRWWVQFLPFNTMEEFEGYIGDTKENYFPALFNAVRENKEAVHKWLAEYPISDKFKGLTQAPATKYKEMMVSTERANHEGVDDIESIIIEGGFGVCSEVLSFKCLSEMVTMSESDFEFNTSRGARVLSFMGYSKHPVKVKWNGAAHTIWLKNHMENDEIREKLDKTSGIVVPF